MPSTKEPPLNVTLIGKTKTKTGQIKPLFSVACIQCGQTRNITRSDHAKRLALHPCKTCSNKNNHPQGHHRGIRISWANKYKFGSTYRSMEWQLTVDDIADILERQNHRCALSGIPISASGDLATITASIDRIDNSRGYEPSNIQIVHKKVNMARGSLSVEDFVNMCRSVAEHKVC